MGASISLDSKYKLILDVEVDCISTSDSKKHDGGKKQHHNHHSDSGSESGSGSGSGSESGSESGSSSGSDSCDNDDVLTVKITPDIIGHLRNYVRNNDFLDILDSITEIGLEDHGHGPESALVFNSQSVVYNVNDNKIEVSGEWEYFEAKIAKPSGSSSKSSRKHKSKGGSRHHGNDNEDDGQSSRHEFKTKDDELAVSEIENLIAERCREYSKEREFIIHETKTSFLSLNIHNVEITKQ